MKKNRSFFFILGPLIALTTILFFSACTQMNLFPNGLNSNTGSDQDNVLTEGLSKILPDEMFHQLGGQYLIVKPSVRVASKYQQLDSCKPPASSSNAKLKDLGNGLFEIKNEEVKHCFKPQEDTELCWAACVSAIFCHEGDYVTQTELSQNMGFNANMDVGSGRSDEECKAIGYTRILRSFDIKHTYHISDEALLVRRAALIKAIDEDKSQEEILPLVNEIIASSMNSDELLTELLMDHLLIAGLRMNVPISDNDQSSPAMTGAGLQTIGHAVTIYGARFRQVKPGSNKDFWQTLKDRTIDIKESVDNIMNSRSNERQEVLSNTQSDAPVYALESVLIFDPDPWEGGSEEMSSEEFAEKVDFITGAHHARQQLEALQKYTDNFLINAGQLAQ